jgi:hypothetical protein
LVVVVVVVCVWMGWGLGLWGHQMISMDKHNSFFSNTQGELCFHYIKKKREEPLQTHTTNQSL